MENFFQRHAYLVQHVNATMTRSLMDEIDWNYRLIGIKGPRGVGKTTFLLQYAKRGANANFGRCLYININSFYFQGRGIVDFAEEFVKRGGKVLIIDQIFKQNDWEDEIVACYHRFPQLNIVYATTTVERPDANEHELSRLSQTYVLHGFSLREYINLQTGSNVPRVTLDDILYDTEATQKVILQRVRPWNYMQNYLHHGYYPIYLENRNFIENLLKAINAMLEVDILFIKQIDVKYLPRLKKLLYQLALSGESVPNVSNIAKEIGISRTTVTNYVNSLEEARLIHQLSRVGDEDNRKPGRILMHNTNLMYSILSGIPSDQEVMDTFFVNSIWRHHKVQMTKKPNQFCVDDVMQFCVCDRNRKRRREEGVINVRYNAEVAQDAHNIPIWMFGFLY